MIKIKKIFKLVKILILGGCYIGLGEGHHDQPEKRLEGNPNREVVTRPKVNSERDLIREQFATFTRAKDKKMIGEVKDSAGIDRQKPEELKEKEDSIYIFIEPYKNNDGKENIIRVDLSDITGNNNHGGEVKVSVTPFQKNKNDTVFLPSKHFNLNIYSQKETKTNLDLVEDKSISVKMETFEISGKNPDSPTLVLQKFTYYKEDKVTSVIEKMSLLHDETNRTFIKRNILQKIK